jgi:hypothetical protein
VEVIGNRFFRIFCSRCCRCCQDQFCADFGRHEGKSHHGAAPWWSPRWGVRCKLDFRRSVLIPECVKGNFSSGSKTSRPNEAGEGLLQPRSLVVDEGRLFISGPAIVIIFEDNRPISRHLGFSLMRVCVLLPQPEMAEDALYHVGFMNQADDLHFVAASGTAERVYFPDFLDELPPGFGRNPAWLMVGDIQHRHLGAHPRTRRLIAGSEEPRLDPLSPASA